MQSSIWFEKYKPLCIADLILPNDIRSRFKWYVENESLPNLGFWSVQPGLGKSSTANAIINDLGCEALWINASMEKGIDTIRNKIRAFADRASFDGKIKVVVMDECDALTPDAQASFRAFLDEKSLRCRFIFTGNYKNKLIDPLLDRLENYDFAAFKIGDVAKEIVERCISILNSEGVQYDVHDVASLIKARFPCIRAIFVDLQRLTDNGRFQYNDELIERGYTEIKSVLSSRDFDKIYTYINQLSSPDSVYTYIFKNFDQLFGDLDNIKKAHIILILGKYQEMDARVRDKYLNACACFLEIVKIL